jgi:hypothetical protein
MGFAQQVPEIGYVYPPGGRVGTTVEVKLGGYDWTPDMQLFVLDSPVKLEITGPRSEVLVAPPPYWFGAKGRGPAFPQPREFPAKLTIPAGTPPGVVRWQVANANGASATGEIYVGQEPEIIEDARRKAPQPLPSLPVAVAGQIMKIEEIDRYQFTATATGPVTIELFARRIGSPLNAIVMVHDASGRLVVDAADTESEDVAFTFAAQAGATYTVSLHDLDFRGDRSYVYRLALSAGPRILAAIPAAGKRGESRNVEFVGYGLATGAAKIESVTKPVTFPSDAKLSAFDYRLETPSGAATFSLGISDLAETIEPSQTALEARKLVASSAVTGTFDVRYGEDRYLLEAKKGEIWSLRATTGRANSSRDLALAIIGPDGKELARNDDLPKTTDAGLQFASTADGAYQIVVSDVSGMGGDRTATYRLALEPASPGFTLSAPALLNVPMDGKVVLIVPATRLGDFKDAITLSLSGLPAGVTVPAEITIAAGKPDARIDVTCAADAAATASFVTVTGTAKAGERTITAKTDPLLVATVMKPRVNITPEGLDDVRTWPRGSTYPGPVLISRLEGYTGEVTLEMAAKQERHRQGVCGPEVVVPAGVERFEYPVYMPEWLETTKTSRIVINSVVKTPDAKGNVRYLVNRMKMRIGFLPKGALLKLAHQGKEFTARPGQSIDVPLVITRDGSLGEPVKLELVLNDELTGTLVAQPMTLPASQTTATFRVSPVAGKTLSGEQEITIRATAMQKGALPVISETSLVVDFQGT